MTGYKALRSPSTYRFMIEPLISPTIALLDEPSLNWLDLIGRIRPGADPTAIEAQMQVQLRQFLLSPLSKVEERDKPLVAKQMLHFSHGGNGVQMMRDQYQQGLHLLMWVSGFVSADRLRQSCQPDAGAVGQSTTADIGAVGTGRTPHDTGPANSDGKHRAGRTGWDSGDSSSICGHAGDSVSCIPA